MALAPREGKSLTSPPLWCVCVCEYVLHVNVTMFECVCALLRVTTVRLSRSKWRRGTTVKLKVHYKKMVLHMNKSESNINQVKTKL